MKMIKILGVVAASAIVTQFVLFAAETDSSGVIDIENRLRLEYDDNIYETHTDKTGSFKVIEEVVLGVTLDFEPTFITLRYRPSFIYWENRDPDNTDWHQDLDVVINHQFSPRVSAGIKNVFRIADNPNEIEDGGTLEENGKYTYNVTDGNVDVQVLPRTHAVVGGRYTVLDYSEDDVADTENYDIYAVGLTLRHSLSPNSDVTTDVRYENVEYDLNLRSSESIYAGLGFEHIIGASFVGTVRGGYQNKSFEDDSISDEESPYADATLTYIYSPRTRFSLGAGYSMFEADVYPYASQDRTIVYASVAHELTAKISLYLSGSFQLSDYTQDDSIDPDLGVPDGNEEVTQTALRVAYRLNSRNSLEANYQYMDLNSDIREEFDRNRVSLGWRLDI